MKIRFQDVKADCATVLNLASTDSRVLGFVNRAQERLLYSGMYVDTTVRYAVCVTEKCLVWPREVETIESCHVCNRPVTIRGPWYEALDNGPGLMQADSCGPCLTLVDRGNTVTFDWITTTGYKLAIYGEHLDDSMTGTVLIRYYDSFGNKVYTTYGGNEIEGERISIPFGGYNTLTYEALPYGIYHVEKPVTKRVVRLYAKKISDATLRPLAYYEPDETLPVYRHSYLTTLDGGSCDETQVTIIAKKRFIPAINDASVLMIPHAEAIRLAVQAVYKEQSNLLADAALYWQMAKNCLNDQLRHHRGTGQVDPIRFATSDSWGGAVYNII